LSSVKVVVSYATTNSPTRDLESPITSAISRIVHPIALSFRAISLLGSGPDESRISSLARSSYSRQRAHASAWFGEFVEKCVNRPVPARRCQNVEPLCWNGYLTRTYQFTNPRVGPSVSNLSIFRAGTSPRICVRLGA